MQVDRRLSRGPRHASDMYPVAPIGVASVAGQGRDTSIFSLCSTEYEVFIQSWQALGDFSNRWRDTFASPSE